MTTSKRLRINRLSDLILRSAFKVHSNLGPGLLESAYSHCLFHELKRHGLLVERNREWPLKYQGLNLDLTYCVEMIVEGQIVIISKSVENLTALHSAEMQTYLHVSGCDLGFVFNFNVGSLKHGVRRIINNMDESVSTAVS